MAAAEELGVPLERVRVVLCDTARTPDDGITAGSRTTPATVPAVRRAAAAARGWLSAEKRLLENPRLREPGEWKILGRGHWRADAREIVTGAHRFPSDIVREGMLYGCVLRPRPTGRGWNPWTLKPPGRPGPWPPCATATSPAARPGPRTRRAGRWRQWPRRRAGPAGKTFPCGIVRPPALDRAGAGLVAGRPHPPGRIPHRLHPARADGAAGRGGGMEGRTADGVDRNQQPVQRARGAGPRLRPARRGRAGDRAGFRRRLRRQAHGRGGARGRPAGQGGGAPGESAVDARGGIPLGLFPSGGADRRGGGAGRRENPRLAIYQLQLRGGGASDALRDSCAPREVRALRPAAAPGLLPDAGRHGEPLRPRGVHGRAGHGRRHRSARFPPGPSGQRACIRAVLLAACEKFGWRERRGRKRGAQPRHRPGLRDGEELGRRRLRRGGSGPRARARCGWWRSSRPSSAGRS